LQINRSAGRAAKLEDLNPKEIQKAVMKAGLAMFEFTLAAIANGRTALSPSGAREDSCGPA
jgi:hypothetical protein